MIWLGFRQLRAQVTIGAAVLGAAAIYLLIVGLAVRHAHHALAGCGSPSACNVATLAFKGRFDTELTLLSGALIAAPALLGALLGAPVVARELEGGTLRLIWAQSVTRRRWLAVRLASVVLCCVAISGVAAALLTWAAAPLDATESRFAVVAFDARDVVPLAYAAFAATLGVLTGLLLRRTVGAIALTLAIFAAVQVAVPIVVRPHLMAPVSRTVSFGAGSTVGRPLTFLTARDGGSRYLGYTIPGAWILSRSELTTPTGQHADVESCINPAHLSRRLEQCVARHRLHWTIRYQPAGRYWAFQWIEFGGFLLLSAVLAAIALWRIGRLAV